MKNRKQLVKARLAERRKFFDMVAQMNKATYRAQKARLRLEPGTFRVTFTYSPSELEIDCKPTEENIQKLGLQRALSRLDRRDFITSVGIIAHGKPTKENLDRLRLEVLENTKKRFKKDGTLDLTSFSTTAGETNETEQGSTTTT